MTVDPINFNYDTVDMKQELVDAFKAVLQTMGYSNVKVLKSNPKSPAELPCIGINRLNDDETSQSIADFQGSSYDSTSQTFTTTQGTMFAEAMEVRIWHTNADERSSLYNVIRAIMFAYRLSWVEKGIMNVSLKAGRDEEDASMTQAPEPIYWSVITMTYLNPMNVDIIDTTAPISDVSDGGVLDAQGG